MSRACRSFKQSNLDLAEAKYLERKKSTRENWIMANATSQNTPQYVQQAFNWDLVDADPVSGKTPTALVDALSSARPQRSNRQPITVPTYATSTSARRGRCEHVGGILASVLERYGIGIDQLIAEIDGMK